MEQLNKMTPEDFLVDCMVKYEIDPDELKRAYVARLTYNAMVEKDPEEEAWLALNMSRRVHIIEVKDANEEEQ